MNKQGTSTITMMLIGLLAFIAIIGLANFANNEFISTLDILPQNDSGEYANSLAYLNDSSTLKLSILDEIENDANAGGFLQNAWNSALAIGTTMGLGISTLVKIFELPGILKAMFENINITLNIGPAGIILVGFLISAMTLFIIMKILQAVRGTNELA